MDQDKHYKVVFSGNTLPGHTRDDVAARFATAFKLKDKPLLQQLFSGKIVTLKRGLSYEQAQHYSLMLEKLGADCCIECTQPPLFNTFAREVDHDYERKKRQRLAQFEPQNLANLELAPK